MRNIYAIALKAQFRGIGAVKAGISARYIYLIVRQVIEKAGCGECFITTLSYSLGLTVHEYPIVPRRSTDIIKPSRVIIVEQRIYLLNMFGV